MLRERSLKRKEHRKAIEWRLSGSYSHHTHKKGDFYFAAECTVRSIYDDDVNKYSAAAEVFVHQQGSSVVKRKKLYVKGVVLRYVRKKDFFFFFWLGIARSHIKFTGNNKLD